ncbi:MAG: hypothetical protein ACJAXJ_000012 [Colwellia sp.]|jgi:hypothetical protein|tara:strand:- start:28091 stop:28240 length:150 start_codon:yes stop_codon:yes gene_type:complete
MGDGLHIRTIIISIGYIRHFSDALAWKPKYGWIGPRQKVLRMMLEDFEA